MKLSKKDSSNATAAHHQTRAHLRFSIIRCALLPNSSSMNAS